MPSLASAGSSAATSSASTSSAGTSSAGTGGVGGGSESEGVGAGSGSGSASGSGMGTMGSIAAESVGSGTADNLMGGIFQASRPLSPDQASLDTADVLLRDSPPQVPPPPSQLLNTTMPSTPQQQRSSRTEGYAFPDIFGAASSWLNGAGAHLAHSTGLRGKVSRSVVDAEVSRIMSEFWTTFAAYGDPNGQPAHSSGRTSGRYVSTSNNNRRGHSSGDLNGYVSGSCAEGVPWWPRVLGDIPSRQEMQEMQRKAYSTTATPAPPSPTPAAAVSGSSPDSRGHEQEGTYFWQRDEDSAAQFPYAPSSRYSKSAEAKGEGISDSPEDDLDGGDSAGDNAPTIRSTVGRGDSNWAEIVVRSSPPKTRNSARTKQELYAGSRHTNKELISRYTRNLRSVVTKYMHHMVFDEESSVNIVQNDCICNQWNALEYRF